MEPAMKIDSFYKQHSLRMIQIRRGHKAPLEKGWPEISRPYDEVETALKDPEYNKVGWILDDNHVVIDIDCHAGGANGFESLAKLEKKLGYLLDEVCGAFVDTPSGGRHYYFSKPEDAEFGKVFADHYPGIDFIAGKGKQLIAAGSGHDQFPGKTYELKGNGLSPIPTTLLEHLQSLSAKQAEFKPPSSQPLAAPRAGDEYNKELRGLHHLMESLRGAGYVVRPKADYWEFDRPGKTSSAQCSGHVGMISDSGNYQLTCFSASDQFFPHNVSMSIFHAFALLLHGGDEKKAAGSLYEQGFAQVDFSRLEPLVKGVDLATSLKEHKLQFPSWIIAGSGLVEAICDDFEVRAKRTSDEMNVAVAVNVLFPTITRLVKDDSSEETPINLYSVLTAPTGAGKDRARKFVNSMLQEVRPDVLGNNSITSCPGLLERLRKHPATLCVIDEFADDLDLWMGKNASALHSDIVSALKKLYTSCWDKQFNPRMTRAHKNSQGQDMNDMSCVQPHLSLFGLCTKSQFFASFSRKRKTDGFFGRFTVFELDEGVRKKRVDRAIPLNVVTINRLKALILSGGNLGELDVPDLEATPQVIQRSDAAVQRLEDHYELTQQQCEVEEKTNEFRAAVWNRAPEKTARFAIMFAIAREGKIVGVQMQKEDADRAIALTNFLTRRLLQTADALMSDSLGEDERKRVLGKIRPGETLTHTKLLRRCSWISTDQLRQVCKTLHDRSDIAIQSGSNGGTEYLRL